ncbi:uncharacterized protein IUM83_12175 [Phytophthora cinnamomi]|uniref:uncharacterized protein n=1 Tax=Phytophthora cinnamomi TaxID=4785 RepID=UPI003559948B|nr:hypothetical protein IUM83_12175 [Phytophthora cinnamomi]
MAIRRENRSDHEGLLSLLQGRSAAERQRLMTEHRAYVSGESNMDVDFGPSAQTIGAAAYAAMEPAVRPAAALRPRPIPAPPQGKNASYLANANRPKDTDFAAEAAPQKKALGKSKITKRQKATIQRVAMKAKETRALA